MEKQSSDNMLDDIALTAVMLDPSDLTDLGRLLSKIDKFLSDEGMPSSGVSVAKGIKTVLEKSILGEDVELVDLTEKLNKAISLLQECCRQKTSASDNRCMTEFNRLFGKELGLDELNGTVTENSADTEPEELIDFSQDREDRECFVGFVAEATEYLQQIEIDILALEQAPENHDHINAIFRPFHTMKGLSGFLNLTDIHKLTHDIETILDKARNDELSISSSVIDIILDTVDVLKKMITDVKDALDTGVLRQKNYHVEQYLVRIAQLQNQENAASEPLGEPSGESISQPETERQKPVTPAPSVEVNQDRELLLNFVAESLEHLQQIEVDILALEQSPDDKEHIDAIFRPFHTIKGVAGFLNLHEIKKLAHEAESVLDKARAGELTVTSKLTDLVLEVVDVLKKMVTDIRQFPEPGATERRDYNLDFYLSRLKGFQEGLPIKDQPKVQVTVAPAPSKVAEHPRLPSPDDSGPKLPGTPAITSGSSIKVDSSKLDNLVDMVGELVIVQSLIFQNPHIRAIRDQKLIGDFSQLNRITSDLQKTSMSLRMVPIKQTFQKMIRLVRDLAKKSGKLVELFMNGEETEIDRNMVDAIYDPLVHMIRNAVDHGIETSDNRRVKGKSETGSIWLRAYQKGGNIIIEIQDDGHGLNREKILKKAKDKGLIKNTEAISVFETENLIFQPGFSTADKITDVSGRGVGMDVVKKAIEKLRGRVEINSVPGQGSTFTLKLPLTLAIIDGIVVKVGPERYIIPTTAIKETIRPKKDEYSTVHGKCEMIRVRGKLLPLIRLHRMFRIESEYQDPCQALVVVVENEGRQKCLLIDDLLGKQEAVIKSLGEHMKNVKGLAGGTILGDGKVGLILDMNGLFAVAEEQGSFL